MNMTVPFWLFAWAYLTGGLAVTRHFMKENPRHDYPMAWVILTLLALPVMSFYTAAGAMQALVMVVRERWGK